MLSLTESINAVVLSTEAQRSLNHAKILHYGRNDAVSVCRALPELYGLIIEKSLLLVLIEL